MGSIPGPPVTQLQGQTDNSSADQFPGAALHFAVREQSKTRPASSGRDAQYNFPALVRRTSKHFVGDASFFEREYSPNVRKQMSAVDQSCNLVQSPSIHTSVDT